MYIVCEMYQMVFKNGSCGLIICRSALSLSSLQTDHSYPLARPKSRSSCMARCIQGDLTISSGASVCSCIVSVTWKPWSIHHCSAASDRKNSQTNSAMEQGVQNYVSPGLLQFANLAWGRHFFEWALVQVRAFPGGAGKVSWPAKSNGDGFFSDSRTTGFRFTNGWQYLLHTFPVSLPRSQEIFNSNPELFQFEDMLHMICSTTDYWFTMIYTQLVTIQSCIYIPNC